MTALFWLFGVLNLAHGAWMLWAPATWYHHLPAGVPDTGPLNVHFVRDIGAAFMTLGAVFCATAPAASRRRGVVQAAAMFFVLHALVHVADLVQGRLAPHHWLLDVPGVFLPALVLVVLALPRWWPAAEP